ncbi:MAG: sensor histidine kinase [Patescibacteria group bacterium]|mgnify:CR=1 FL=1
MLALCYESVNNITQFRIANNITKNRIIQLEIAARYMNSELKSGLNADVVRKILKISRFTGDYYFANVSLIGTDGNEIFKYDRIKTVFPGDLKNVSGDSLFKKAITSGQPVFGKIKVSGATFEPYLPLTVPVFSLEGEIIGALSAEVNVREVFAVISKIDVAGRGESYLVDDTGLLISHRDYSLVLKNINYSGARKIVDEVLKEKKAVVSATGEYVYENEKGTEVLAAADYIPSVGWAIIVEDPKSEATRQSRLIEIFFWVITTVGFFSIAALERLVAKLIKTGEKIEKLREEYTAMMAHEMRAPIEGIRKVSEVLLGEKIKKDEKAHDDFVRMITSNATVMLQLINDYLDAAKLEAGKLEISSAEFEFAPFVDERIMYFEPLAEEKKLRFAKEFSPDLPLKIFCDKIRLTQVFNNLISNAVKFNGPAGEIRIQALIHKKEGNIAREAEKAGIHWFVSGKEPVWKEAGDSFVGAVTDTGQGIEEGDIPKLFTKFTQIKTSGRKGTGLGLMIVKGIIEAHGGKAGVASTPGEGSTFFFTLPLK